MSTLNRAVVHHTAMDSNFNTTGLETSKVNVRAIQNYDMDTNGWCDIGYHFMIDKYGYIFEALSGSMTSYVRGAHDGINNSSFAFCVMGNFVAGHQTPAPAQFSSLYDVVAWRMPNGWSPYGGGTYGTRSNVGYVCGDRDARATACPGDNMYAKITTNLSGGEMRNEVNRRIVGVINPAYQFTSNAQGWTSVNALTGIAWTNTGWPGIIYADQTGGDGYFHGPTCSFTGAAGQYVHIRVYPQSGTSAQHNMRVLWTTSSSPNWAEDKTTPLIAYSAQNAWADVYCQPGANWANQTITQLRLDVDEISVGARWIIDTVEIVTTVPGPTGVTTEWNLYQ